MDGLFLIRLITILAFLLAALYFSYILLKKNKNKKSLHKNSRIIILERKQIDSKHLITLIKIDEQQFIVASTHSAISVLPCKDV